MKIENWLLKGADELEGLVLPADYNKSPVLLVGNVYGRENFPDGALVSTSCIVDLSETHATTQSGKVYELGEMNSDYMKFINASENNIPIIKEWRITTGGNPNSFFGRIMGYEDKILEGSVLGNITSINPDENLYEINNQKFFIDWLSIDFGQYTEMRFFWNDENRNALLDFAHKFIKLDLQNKIHQSLF